jgi:ribonuclease HII
MKRSMIYAGIDEAGYGPLLGPLCVGCAAFVLPGAAANADGPPCLWKALSGAVCRTTNDRRRRIAVGDSKKLKGAKDAAGHPLRHLERGVAAFASAVPGAPAEWNEDDALLAALGARPEDTVARGEPRPHGIRGAAPAAAPPWHAERHPLPVGNDAATLRIAGAMLRASLSKAGLECAGLRVRAIDAAEFNAQAGTVGNKATVNFMAAMLHVDAVRRMAAARGLDAWVALDRQGGRTTYREPLQSSFPDARIRILEESEGQQRYRLEFEPSAGLPAHAVTVGFELGGEERHLPIALASMAAKFARELHMRRLNAFFARHVPELRPTAGYVQDGRRWLSDVGSAAKDLGIAESALVRCI